MSILKRLEFISDNTEYLRDDESKYINKLAKMLASRILLVEESDEEETVSYEESSKDNVVIAYVDGSYDKETKMYGSGVVILDSNENIIEEISYVGEDKHNIWQVAGECVASKIAVKYAVLKGCKGIKVYHDYQGISSWALGEWKTKNDFTKEYKQTMSELMEQIDVEFVKVKAHVGIKWNEYADKLAKKGLGK